MKRWRQYLSSLTVVSVFVVLAGAAFAAEGLLESPDPADSLAAGETVIAPVEPSAKTTEAPKPPKPAKEEKTEEESEADGPPSESGNHGQCVSKWVHEAKSQELEGRAKGQFVSSIAKDKTALGSECDFQAQLTSALEAEAASDQEVASAETDEKDEAGEAKKQTKSKKSRKAKGKKR